MKRRTNETSKASNNLLQTPTPKRSRSQQIDENINPNIQNQHDMNEVQVQGIFNRLMVGKGNKPSQENSSQTPQTVTFPSSSAYMPEETKGM